MESIARPLRRLQEEAAWFARAQELRLLHVRTHAPLRGAVLDLLLAQEQHADNRALYFRFDDPAAPPGRGWAERAARLREMWGRKAAAIAPAGIALRPLGDGPRGLGAGDFAATLLAAGGCLAAPVTQVVMVLAPARVEDGARFLDELAALVDARELAHVRWIVVEVDGDAVAPLAERLAPAALACVCIVDEKEQQDDLVALGAATSDDAAAVAVAATPATPASPASAQAPAWRAPGAMPEDAPPPRPGGGRRANDAQLRAAGLSPAFVGGGGVALKRLVLGAALALRQGRGADAVTLQARAAALCAEMEMPRAQVLNLHVLGGYRMAQGARSEAIEIYRAAGAVARAGGFADLEAQSELALGMIEAVERRPAQAATHYATAGRLAEAAAIEVLAIECWRMAGQLALEARLEPSAIECWRRALALADPLDAGAARATSAAEVARALAAILHRRGQAAQAQSLEQRSVELEQGTPPPTPDHAADDRVVAAGAEPAQGPRGM